MSQRVLVPGGQSVPEGVHDLPEPVLPTDAATKAYVDNHPGLEGPQGPPGEEGPEGPQGNEGPPGPSLVILGEGPPLAVQPGYLYVELEDGVPIEFWTS